MLFFFTVDRHEDLFISGSSHLPMDVLHRVMWSHWFFFEETKATCYQVHRFFSPHRTISLYPPCSPRGPGALLRLHLKRSACSPKHTCECISSFWEEPAPCWCDFDGRWWKTRFLVMWHFPQHVLGDAVDHFNDNIMHLTAINRKESSNLCSVNDISSSMSGLKYLLEPWSSEQLIHFFFANKLACS